MAQPGKDDYANLLRGWFERDLSRYARWDRDVEIHHTDRDGTIIVYIYTETNRYHISAGPSGGRYGGYLGCTAQSRKPRAGEDWCRGNDLHDGPCEEATWIGILGDILSYEMVRVHKDDSKSIGPRGSGDQRVDETPPTHTADKPACGTAPPDFGPLESDAAFRLRIRIAASYDDQPAINVASPSVLDLIGEKYKLYRKGSERAAVQEFTEKVLSGSLERA